MRVLCFHNAGSAEDMYTSEGTGARRSPSPLLVSTAQLHSLNMMMQSPTLWQLLEPHDSRMLQKLSAYFAVFVLLLQCVLHATSYISVYSPHQVQ